MNAFAAPVGFTGGFPVEARVAPPVKRVQLVTIRQLALLTAKQRVKEVVLPTGRTARFASGLSVYDFLKRTTYVSATEASLAAIGPAAVALAEAEGLTAHARSVAIRLGG